MLLALLPVCVGICISYYLLRGLSHAFEIQWCLSLFGLLAWFGFRKASHDRFAMIPLCLALAAAAGAWHDLRRNYFSVDELARYATQSPQPVCCEALAVGAPQPVPAPPFDPLRSIPPSPQCRLLVDVVALRNGTEWRPASGRAGVTVECEQLEIHAGDRLRIFGHLSAPSPADNPGDFDFAEFARDQRELSLLRVKNSDCIRVVATASPWNPTRWLDTLRQNGTRLLEEFIPHDHSGLASAVLLGEREYVDEDTNEAFLETGTIHILCIAGLHIGIVAAVLFAIFGSGWISRRTAIVCVMGILGGYMLLTMARPPVMRATLLVWIVCGGLLLGRRSWGWNSLALAGCDCAGRKSHRPDAHWRAAIVSFRRGNSVGRPKVLSDTNVDPLDRLIAATRPWPQRMMNRVCRHLFEVFVVGLAMWAVITPLTMARFHLLSPAGLILNVLLIPVLGLVVISGMGVLAFRWWLPPLAAAFGWLCNFSLAILEHTVKWAAHLPGARFWVAGPSELWLAVFYLASRRDRIYPALAAAAALADCAVGRLVRYRLARRCAASRPQRYIALHLRRRRPRRRGAVGTA